VLGGVVVFHIGAETVCARPGDVVVAPKRVPRTFRVVSDHARWLVLTSLRSLARYEEFAKAVTQPSEPAADPTGSWASDPDAAVVRAIAASNGIAVLGPPGMLPEQFEQAEADSAL
jgi:hypothetical protein